MQDELDELFVFLLANPLDEAVGLELLAELVGGQAVLGETKVEERGHVHATRGIADLFLLFDEVGAADETDGAFLAQPREDVEDLGGCVLPIIGGVVSKVEVQGQVRLTWTYTARGCEGSVDVKEADGVLERALGEGRVGGGHGFCVEVCLYGVSRGVSLVSARLLQGRKV